MSDSDVRAWPRGRRACRRCRRAPAPSSAPAADQAIEPAPRMSSITKIGFGLAARSKVTKRARLCAAAATEGRPLLRGTAARTAAPRGCEQYVGIVLGHLQREELRVRVRFAPRPGARRTPSSAAAAERPHDVERADRAAGQEPVGQRRAALLERDHARVARGVTGIVAMRASTRSQARRWAGERPRSVRRSTSRVGPGSGARRSPPGPMSAESGGTSATTRMSPRYRRARDGARRPELPERGHVVLDVGDRIILAGGGSTSSVSPRDARSSRARARA